MTKITMTLFCLVWLTLSQASADVPSNFPTVANYILAEQAKVRALTASEVETVSGNWLTTFVYLEAAIRANLQGRGVVYLDLANRPSDDCINATLYDYLRLTHDGDLSQSDLALIWETNGALSYFAHLIATDGQTSAYLKSRLDAAGFNLNRMGFSVLTKYYRIRATEPYPIDEKIDHWIRKALIVPQMGTARLIELGQPGRDALWRRMLSLAPPSDTDSPMAVVERQSLVGHVIRVLAASNDVRLKSFPQSEVQIIESDPDPLGKYDFLQYINRVKNQTERDIQHGKLVIFWTSLECGIRSHRRKTP